MTGRPARRSGRVMHLPEDLRDPARVIVYSGPAEKDAWPALYLAGYLQRAFGEAELTVVCPERDGGLWGMLRWAPTLLTYADRPALPEGLAEGDGASRTILFHPYTETDPAAERVAAESSAGVTVSASAGESWSIRVRSRERTYPEVLAVMCRALGIEPDLSWRPELLPEHAERASELMAPVSGRALPYIAVGTDALAALEKHRAEIPLRTVTVTGRQREFPDLDRPVRAAIVAGATAAAASDPSLWAEARALGVPAVGMDGSGSFPRWGGVQPSRDERELVDAWSGLLRRGW